MARVDAPTADAWSGRLSAEPSTATQPAATSAEATLNAGSPERVVLRDLAFGAPGNVLVRVTADGRQAPVTAVAFFDARLVVDGGTAVGAATGRVLVVHHGSVNDAGITLSLVDLATSRRARRVSRVASSRPRPWRA